MSNHESHHQDTPSSNRRPLLYGEDGKPLPLSAKTKKLLKKEQTKSRGPQGGFRAHKKVIGLSLSAMTIIGALVVFVPRPTVIPTDPVDPTNSMSASFTIANAGLIPLNHVTAWIALGTVTANKSTGGFVVLKGAPKWQTKITVPDWKDHSLHMDERFTISPEDLLGQLTSVKGWYDAEIAVDVEYQPWFLPIKREKLFGLRTHRQTDGKLYWYSFPVR